MPCPSRNAPCKTLDQQPHQMLHQLRILRCELVEFFLRELDQLGVSRSDDRCRPRVTGEDAHFADRFALRHLTDLASLAGGIVDQHLHSSADDDVEAVGWFALTA